jgi:hypothetical protein
MGESEKNQGWTPVRVECASGIRLNEKPRYVFRGDQRIAIIRILDEWVEEREEPPRQRCRIYTVFLENLEVGVLKKTESEEEWFYKETIEK